MSKQTINVPLAPVQLHTFELWYATCGNEPSAPARFAESLQAVQDYITMQCAAEPEHATIKLNMLADIIELKNELKALMPDN